MSKWGEIAQLYADNQEWKHKHMQQLKKEERKRMKQTINIKAPDHTYEREVMLSGHIAVPKEKYRRMIISEVVGWGIAVFLLLVTVLR